MAKLPEPASRGKGLPACNPDPAILDFLGRRRSTSLALLGEPGPNAQQLEQILTIASRVPDHRRVVPWRFIVFEGRGKQIAAEKIGRRYGELHPQSSLEDTQKERRKFACTPMVIALVSKPDRTHKTPVWEQELVAGAVGQTLLLAANASGFAGNWLTYWYAFDQQIMAEFGLISGEQIAGFFHLGTASENPLERPRPDVSKLVTRWQPQGPDPIK